MPISEVLTDEEQATVDEGEAASFLLENPLFLKAIEAIRRDCAEAILTSPPDATKGREETYHLARALSAITQELTGLSAAGEAIMAAHEQHHLPFDEEGGENPD